MKFSTKSYKIAKVKQYLKKNDLFFFFNGISKNSNNWIKTEQGFKKMDYEYYKIVNKTALKTFDNSIYTNTTIIVNGPTFFIKPIVDSNPLSKSILLNNFEPLMFTLLAIKINNKIYGIHQVEYVNSLKYKENVKLFYQFGITNLKSSFKVKL